MRGYIYFLGLLSERIDVKSQGSVRLWVFEPQFMSRRSVWSAEVLMTKTCIQTLDSSMFRSDYALSKLSIIVLLLTTGRGDVKVWCRDTVHCSPNNVHGLRSIKSSGMLSTKSLIERRVDNCKGDPGRRKVKAVNASILQVGWEWISASLCVHAAFGWSNSEILNKNDFFFNIYKRSFCGTMPRVYVWTHSLYYLSCSISFSNTMK